MISRLYARQDAPILLPLKKLSSPTGLPIFCPSSSHWFGKLRSSPPEGKPRGSPLFLTRILLRASTGPYFLIFFPPPLLRPTLPSLSLATLTTSLSVRRRLRSPSQSPPILPLLALTQSPTLYGNRFTGDALPSSPISSLLYYAMDITPPP